MPAAVSGEKKRKLEVQAEPAVYQPQAVANGTPVAQPAAAAAVGSGEEEEENPRKRKKLEKKKKKAEAAAEAAAAAANATINKRVVVSGPGNAQQAAMIRERLGEHFCCPFSRFQSLYLVGSMIFGCG